MRYLADKKIGVIGLGNMGCAILNGLTASGMVRKNFLYGFDADKDKCRRAKKKFSVNITASAKEIADLSDVVIIAVKPQDIRCLLYELSFWRKKRLCISIAAGVRTQTIEKILGDRARVIRVMPNTPAIVGEGVSAICKGRYALSADLKTAVEIFSSVGCTQEVREKDLDAVTAVSGSGPAYFFYLIEALVEAAVAMGLKREVAEKLVSRTASGSANLLILSKAKPCILRERVTSKGGTTEAAIKVFEEAKLKNLISKAAAAALRRSKELSRRN